MRARRHRRRALPWIAGAWALLGTFSSLVPAQGAYDTRDHEPSRDREGAVSSLGADRLLTRAAQRSSYQTYVQDPPPSTEPDKKEERLGERLIRQAATDVQEDLMAAVIRMMNEAARKLEIDFDPGESTQAVQQRVVDQLDKAIKEAAMQRRPRRSSDRPQSPDKRRMPGGKPDPGPGATSDRGEPGASRSGTPDGQPTDRPSTDGDLRDIRRTWGHLPMREREEIIQGVGEGYLERYRDWIERYYRALQEAED